ncbi:hypothetical protein PQX77_008610 [Marasmius sp. AFHP31]|nr:hypothetical protein PQX77_008610 [Marasmius sp. AFHP31]
MSAGGNIVLYVLVIMLVIVALFATALSILSVRQRLMNSRIRKEGKQGQDVEAPNYEDFKPRTIPEPMAVYFPHAYRHQMDMEIYGTAPVSRPLEKIPDKKQQRSNHHHHRHPPRQSRRLL